MGDINLSKQQGAGALLPGFSRHTLGYRLIRSEHRAKEGTHLIHADCLLYMPPALDVFIGFLDGASRKHIHVHICLYSKSLNKTSALLILQLSYEVKFIRIIIIQFYK